MLTGCPPRQEPPTPALVTVKGDPISFVEGADMNGEIPLPGKLLEGNPGWNITQAGFVSGPALRSIDAAMKAQMPAKDGAPPRVSNGNSKHILSERAFDYMTTIDGNSITLHFTRTLSDFALSTVTLNRALYHKGVEFDVLHTSYTPDYRAFSTLIYLKIKSTKLLIAYYFSKTDGGVPKLQFTSEPFEYLFGRGVRVGWPVDRPRTLTICGPAPKQMRQWVDKNVIQWRLALQGTLQLRFEHKEICPPFSDLNTHTLRFTKNWIEVAGKGRENGGTQTVADFNRGVLLDADLFILLGEFQELLDIKYGKNKSQITDPQVFMEFEEEINMTILHELGHFLGLHHHPDSIMSYENNPLHLTEYDRAAVRGLYER
jgi:hypothetical protein